MKTLEKKTAKTDSEVTEVNSLAEYKNNVLRKMTRVKVNTLHVSLSQNMQMSYRLAAFCVKMCFFFFSRARLN